METFEFLYFRNCHKFGPPYQSGHCYHGVFQTLQSEQPKTLWKYARIAVPRIAAYAASCPWPLKRDDVSRTISCAGPLHVRITCSQSSQFPQPETFHFTLTGTLQSTPFVLIRERLLSGSQLVCIPRSFTYDSHSRLTLHHTISYCTPDGSSSPS